MFAVPPELIDTPHAHDPVMLREVMSSAAIPAGATIVDGTFGRGAMPVLCSRRSRTAATSHSTATRLPWTTAKR